MSIVMRLENFDEIFEKTITPKYVLNDMDGSSEEGKEFIDSLIMNKQSGDALSLIPSCECGEVAGVCYVGTKCNTCNTLVTSAVDEDLSYQVWIGQAEGVAKLLSPRMLLFLNERYMISSPRISLIEYIMQTNFRIPNGNHKNLHILEKLNFILASRKIKRGYNSFVDNMYEIIDILESEFIKVPKKDRGIFPAFLKEQEKNIFSRFVPIPNKSLFIFDTNETGTYTDRNIISALHAVRTVTGVDLGFYDQRQRENKIAKALSELAKFYKDYQANVLFGKMGLIRKLIAKAKSHYTMRAVVTSNSSIHELDEIQTPWGATCSLFRPIIIKGLRRRGYTYREAVEHFHIHITKYSPVIHEIFKEMIKDSGDGIVCLFVRNPSLHRGSIIRVRITGVKTDVRDYSITVSYLLSPVFNMDFDGDMMNLTPLLTKEAIEESENFSFHHNILGLSGPNEFTGALGIPKSIVSTVSNWFNEEKYMGL